MPGSSSEKGPAELNLPKRLIRFELDGYGLGFSYEGSYARWLGFQARIAKLSFDMGRLRLGISAAEGFGFPFLWGGGAIAPVYLGYTLLSRPKKTAFFYGGYDIYAEAAVGFLGCPNPPYARLSACFDADYYGLGIGLEGGVTTIPMVYQGNYERVSGAYVALRLRFLAFSLEF